MAKYTKKYILWHQDQVFYLELSLCISQEFTEYIPRPNTLMWRLVRGNVLVFSRMFKDFYVLLQITLGNQMLGESEFPL